MLSTARFCRTGQLATADTWFRTCRTSSFCTVVWQLARFQLTRRIARSLGDSWASCYSLQPAVWTQPVVQPVGWTMQMSPAMRRLSGPARTLMTSLCWSAQQGGCVDSAFDRHSRKIILISLFLPSVALWSRGVTKIRSITKLYKTVLCVFIYLIVIWIFKSFRPAGCTTRLYSRGLKRLDQSRCRLGLELVYVQGTTYYVGGLDPQRGTALLQSSLGMPRLVHNRYSQPYSLGGSRDAASGY